MSKGLGHIEQAIARAFACEDHPELAGEIVGVDFRCIARLAYEARNPTNVQRATIRRAMNSFVRKHQGYVLDGGRGRTRLVILGPVGDKPRVKEHPDAEAPSIPAEWSRVNR